MVKENIYNMLAQSLKLVSSPYDVQISSLPEFAYITDEIALIFNDAYLVVPQLKEENLISSHALNMLKQLDDLFEQMSGDKSLWTIEKLINDKSWGESRELALNILKELNEQYGKPDLSFINWTR